MGWIDTSIAKARASASDARADLAEIDAMLHGAQLWLAAAEAADSTARKLAGTGIGRADLIAPASSLATSQTSAQHSRAQAKVDELRARKILAQARLSVAEKSSRAMTRIGAESDKIRGG